MGSEKIRKREELAEIVAHFKKKGRKVGFTNGCFDILHAGHVRYLAAAKKECDILVLAINSDDSVKKLKGNSRPLNGQDARAEVAASLENVDLVTIFGEETPEALIRQITPDILFKGGDWPVEDIVGSEYVLSKGGEVRSLCFSEGYSTTGIIERIRSGRGD
jgi:D-beta-D-heptose 7-phosphate kinase/D-beta-D-heptose 1-phosphate adenosyltransferase